MVSSSKILTVKYGTFSCTAEGFEDPLAAIKDTTHFFRSVVREDRFFGAEPPRVDTELAGELLKRQIAADSGQDNLVLRPASTEVSAGAIASALTSQTATLPATTQSRDLDPVPVAAPQATPQHEAADLAAETMSRAAAPDNDDGGLAARLQRIRDVVADPQDTLDHDPEPVVEDLVDDVTEDLAEDEDLAEASLVAEVPEADVAPQDEPDDALADLLDDITEKNQEPEPETLAQADDTDDAPLILEEPELPEPPVAQAAAEPEPEQPRIRARVVKVKRAVFEDAVARGDVESVEDEDEAPQAEGSLSPEEEAELARELEAVKAELAADWDDDAQDDETGAVETGWDDDEDEGEDEGEEDTTPLRLDNPVQTGQIGWDTDLDLDELDARADAAAAEQSVDLDALAGEADETVRKTVRMASPARALLTEGSVDDGDDTSRILDETNRELEEPEGNRRRSAIAHLRAAVAATRADRLLGRKPDEAEEAEPYREDLATVVRPRRPQAGAQPERPDRPDQEDSASPLRLVAEQRVPEDAEPVRPRRIRRPGLEGTQPAAESAAPVAPASGDSFAAYAESVGAKDLPELLEAAAAYMSFVEGRDQFSRPQLMTTVRQAEQEESSREDRLRSFGQLLREGKIEKTRGGRFTASDRISFKPKRAAG